MRLHNFLVRMGFALFVAVILLLMDNIPLAVIYVVGHLIWAYCDDRVTVRTYKFMDTLAVKHPDVPTADSIFISGEKKAVLPDRFIKSVLLNQISLDDYSSKKKDRKSEVERYYKAVTSGRYILTQLEITKKEIFSSPDCADDYYLYCGNTRFEVNERAYIKCQKGNTLVTARADGFPVPSAAFLLDMNGDNHTVAHEKPFSQFAYTKN